MAEPSFAEEVGKLRLGEGETFRGEGILAVTKALLESGVSYVAGYQGAPISHLMDVLADAEDVLVEHGIRCENSASEATAAATLAASVNYPLRGAVTFKGPVGVNVAADALANLAAGGVTGGAPDLAVVGGGGEAGLRPRGGEPHAGDADAAHPRLPRPRPVRRRGQPHRELSDRRRACRAAARHGTHRPAARDLRARAGKGEG